jgi:hypothetical protein
MITPPIVGVPVLIMWLCGPSTRICLPIFFSRRKRTQYPPLINVSRKAVAASNRARDMSCTRMA